MSVERHHVCEDCGSPLAPGQRYCLECGARVGSRSAALEAMIARTLGSGVHVGDPGAAGSASAQARAGGAGAEGIAADPDVGGAAVAAAAAAGPSAATGLRLPPPRVSALLVLVFLGFGVLMGHVARTPVSDTLASTRSPVKLLLPAPRQASTSTASSSASSESSASESGSEPPASEPESTPEPARSKTTTPTKPSSGGGSSGSKESGKEGGAEEAGGSNSGGSSKPDAGKPATKLPAIKHVFVIMLSDEPYASVFGPSSTAPYLSGTLEHQGELLTRFDAVAHEELADEAALISGQGPTAETVANCPNYTEITPTSTGADEQVLGSGCVYPHSTQTIVSELAAKHLAWRAYLQGTDEGGGTPVACAHPALGQADPTANQAQSGGAYATFRNPFVYFASIVDSPECAANDVGLVKLRSDLTNAKSTPSFAYIVPDRCHDGNPTPCTADAPAGVTPANTFLKQVVPEIMESKAYQESGLLVITTDEAPSSGVFADSSSCCGQPLFPNAPARTVAGSPKGGGTVGALLLSPYVKGATTNEEPFNDFSLLLTIEQLFSLKHLGYSALPAVKPFEPAMFLASKG